MRVNLRGRSFLKLFALAGQFLLYTIIVLLSGLPVFGQSGTIALVQHASKDAGSSSSSTLAFGANNTAGNWIAVCVRAGAINEVISVSDTRGNIYRKAVQFNQTVDGFSGAIYYAEGIAGGANTVTVADSISGTLRFSILEYSGVATSGSLDAGAAAQGHSTSPSTAPSVNTTVNGDLLIGTVMSGNSDSFTAGPGYKIEESVPGQGNAKLIVEDQIQSIAGATTASVTLGSADDWAAGLAAFKAANGTGGTTPTITGLSPTSGVTGTSVVITGTSFGSTQGTSTVKFNGISTTPTFWNSTSITAPVPTGATTGSVIVTVNGLASNGVNFTVNNLAVAVSPKRAAVTLTQTQQFVATVTNDPLNGGVSWSVDGVGGGTSTSGTVSATGLFTPGTQPGVHTVKAASNSNPSTSASSSVAVTDLAGVFTYHNDNARTGQNIQEYALTTSTVNASTFGALFTCTVDGYLYAAPLYVPGLSVGGQTRNVVFLATEHDTVYAFDADSPACVQLWKTNFLSNNVTTVPPGDTGAGTPDDLTPEIGITSTPVIDPSSKTIYVMAKTKETTGTGCSTGNPCYVHRLHALDLITGAEKFGGPVVVSAPNFIPLFHLQRPALLLNNGSVYVAFGSHGDSNTWQGWLMAYNASTLVQQWVWHSTDPTSGDNEGAIWGSGNGPALDATGNIYVETGNGYFDGANNFSDSVVKLSPAGVRLDYFTPFDQSVMQSNDIDLGSSNPIILPDSVGSTAHPHLMIATGKVGVIYLLDQTNMGGYNSAANQDVGEVSVGFNTSNFNGGFYGQPAYWNGNLYTVIVGDSLRQYLISGGNIMAGSSSNSSNTFPYRGATPAVSASGTTNGIVWVADITAYQFGTALILDAYDATNVSRLLYSSPASGTGAAAPAAKFTVPTVANGKVYVGGEYAFTVFGLLPN